MGDHAARNRKERSPVRIGHMPQPQYRPAPSPAPRSPKRQRTRDRHPRGGITDPVQFPLYPISAYSWSSKVAGVERLR